MPDPIVAFIDPAAALGALTPVQVDIVEDSVVVVIGVGFVTKTIAVAIEVLFGVAGKGIVAVRP